MNKNENKSSSTNFKLVIYLGIFLVAIILARTGLKGTSPTKRVEKQNVSTNKKVSEYLDKINSNYYSVNTKITLDGDALSLNYEIADNLEMGIKKFHGTTTEYILYNNNFYELKESEITPLNNFIKYDYDDTFTKLDNLKLLSNIDASTRSYKNDNYDVLEYTYNLKDVLTLYNAINSVTYLTTNNETITLTSYIQNDTLSYIELNLTSLYNLINESNPQEKVIYTLSIKSEREKDVSYIIDKLN